MLLGRQWGRRWILQRIADLLFTDHIGDLGCGSEEVKVTADLASRIRSSIRTAEGVVIEGVLVIVQLIAEAVVSVLEIDSVNAV